MSDYTFQDATEEELTQLIAWIDANGLSDHNLNDLWGWVTGRGLHSTIVPALFESFQELTSHLKVMKHDIGTR